MQILIEPCPWSSPAAGNEICLMGAETSRSVAIVGGRAWRVGENCGRSSMSLLLPQTSSGLVHELNSMGSSEMGGASTVRWGVPNAGNGLSLLQCISTRRDLKGDLNMFDQAQL